MGKCYVSVLALDMSTDPDRKTACPDDLQPSAHGETNTDKNILSDHDIGKKKHDKGHRKVCFPPEDDQLVTEYFEPANPWQDGECSIFWH